MDKTSSQNASTTSSALIHTPASAPPVFFFPSQPLFVTQFADMHVTSFVAVTALALLTGSVTAEYPQPDSHGKPPAHHEAPKREAPKHEAPKHEASKHEEARKSAHYEAPKHEEHHATPKKPEYKKPEPKKSEYKPAPKKLEYKPYKPSHDKLGYKPHFISKPIEGCETPKNGYCGPCYGSTTCLNSGFGNCCSPAPPLPILPHTNLSPANTDAAAGNPNTAALAATPTTAYATTSTSTLPAGRTRHGATPSFSAARLFR